MDESISLLNNKYTKKPSHLYILLPVFFDAISLYGLYAPLIHFYTTIFCQKHFEAEGIENTIPFERCLIPEIQSVTSKVDLVTLVTAQALTMLFAGFYGSLSDRKGRRLVMSIGFIGNMFLMSCYILTYYFPKVFGIWLLFIGPVIQGCLVGDRILLTAAQAYVADSTTLKERTLGFNQMWGAFFVGGTIGPLMSSFILKKTGSPILVFYMLFSSNALSYFYLSFILPESKRPSEKSAVPFNLSILNDRNRFLIAAIQFLLTFIQFPPLVLYAMIKFNWTAYEGGFLVSLTFLVNFLILMLPSLGQDLDLVRTGVLIDILSFTLMGLATGSGGFVASCALQSMGCISYPAIKSFMTRLVDPQEVGQMFGAIAVVESSAMIFSLLVLNLVYSESVGSMPELTFYICAFTSAVALFLTFLVRSKSVSTFLV